MKVMIRLNRKIIKMLMDGRKGQGIDGSDL